MFFRQLKELAENKVSPKCSKQKKDALCAADEYSTGNCDRDRQ